jgi:hypothetical protein
MPAFMAEGREERGWSGICLPRRAAGHIPGVAVFTCREYLAGASRFIWPFPENENEEIGLLAELKKLRALKE